MVGVAQLVEHSVVVRDVAGSSPVTHPMRSPVKAGDRGILPPQFFWAALSFSDSWTFISVPPEESDELRERAAPGPGFGSIPVEVTIGSTTWCTSVFPDKKSGVFVLPVKAAVRKAESIEAGHQAAIALRASL